MPVPILATKLYIPPPRPNIVLRPRLIERLNESLSSGCKLTLLSASAGFGKTTLVSEWIDHSEKRVAWLSLDEGDNDLSRFLTYLIATLQTIAPDIGKGAAAAIQSPQPSPAETTLTTLLNEIAAFLDSFILVLDDYHLIDSQPVDQALIFLVENRPPQMHLVIASREDPNFPLARLRARGQLIELRAADLRFTPAEATEFLNPIMGLNLSVEDVAALEARTEGWIAGLQLAALSMQGQPDPTKFIQSFAGSHRFVMDYLVEEVLRQQTANIQIFLLHTSILDRMCGPLCDAVLGSPTASGQETLEFLEHANLFIVPLDNERRWYRYHHLFGELLRHRLGQILAPGDMAELHIRASQWYEDNSLAFEAFRHATAANDVERAERLVESEAIGLHFRSVAMPVLDWLTSLPKPVLDTRPRLWVRSATLALMVGQTTGVEEKLQATEAVFAAQTASQDAEPDDQTRDLIGQIACARATLALFRYDPDAMIVQARRALEFLYPENLTYRFTANWALTTALMFRGDRAGAAQACQECIDISQKSGHVFSKILAANNMGALWEMENQLFQAAEIYRQALRLFGDHPQPNASIALLGLARICYEWNDLNAAEQYGQQSLELFQQFDRAIDRFIVSEVFLARVKLARGDVEGAASQLAQAEQSARQKNFLLRLPEIAALKVSVLLRQGQVAAAAQLVQQHDLPLCQARVLIAQGEPSAALAMLELLRQEMEEKGWADELLKVMVLQTIALYAHGEKKKAVQVLGEVLALTETNGFIRLFIDEGELMAELLSAAAALGFSPDYANKLLAAYEVEMKGEQPTSTIPDPSFLIEPLSPRELEILRLIAQGLSNTEISRRLFLTLNTIKGHNWHIFSKLQAQNRTEAVARARELGLL
ncbi:MAG: LuxR family transcriptional regulator [Anaerolineae bacterium UTCFX2]|nr:MAG: LuxR family transcriptional regulator [Anaerolineae bacterium UTCFX2]